MLSLSELKEQRPSSVGVDVPVWGGEGTFERLPARHQLEFATTFEALGDDDDKEAGLEALLTLISRCVVTGEGERQFDSEEGREFLRREALPTIIRVGNEAMGLHDLGNAQEETKKND